MTPTKSKRGDDMAEGKESKSQWDKDREDEQKQKSRLGLGSTLEKQKSSESNVISPSKEESDKAAEEIYTKEDEKDGVVTVVSSVSQEEADKVGKTLESIPKYQNLRHALDGVPGDVNLTADGTLNNDRSERMDKTVEELNEIITKTAGPNPMPNREGNELTKAELGFRANVMVAQGNTLRGYAKQLKDIRENGLDDEGKKKLEDMEKGLVGSSTGV